MATNHEARQQSREEVRASIFAKNKFKRVALTLWGVKVEFQQPTLDRVLNNVASEDSSLLLQLLIDQTFVPGSQEKVFDKADIESLKAMPFDAELNQISQVISDLTGGEVEGAEKN